MQPLQSYPVFEADQVLSNGHLNNLLNYLEQQERLTRIKLVGRGIVCGLEINPSNTAIRISKGCGLTSQGFLIQLCDTNYTHFIPYTPPVLPNDLYFLTQCSEEDRSNIPYYGAKDILQLIPDSDKETEGKKSISTINKQDYALVLFLEAEQINLKNCDTQDCNDKGSRMDFTLRVLLVKKTLFDSGKTISFNSILLKRYNVPVADLKTAEDILNGFLAITDDNTLTKLSENLIRSWDKFAVPLGLPAENPLKGLNLITVKKKLSGKTGQRIFVQYFYDFVDDLLKAYIEFRAKMREVFGECCADEMDYPMHLTLGLANENTILGKRNTHRHYFESSPILNGQGKNADEAILLLERLVAMVRGFIGDKLQNSEPITIWNAKSMFDAARVLGSAVRHVYERDGESLKRAGVDFNVSMIFGGQIQGEGMRLFQVYSAGNFIEATSETPFFQVGESKYGKPVLDRVIGPETPLDEAAKCVLVSMDSTLKSNLSVGLPLDLAVYEANRLQSDKITCIDNDNPYFRMLHDTWGQKLREVFDSIEDPTWNGAHTEVPLLSDNPRSQPLKKITNAKEKLI